MWGFLYLAVSNLILIAIFGIISLFIESHKAILQIRDRLVGNNPRDSGLQVWESQEPPILKEQLEKVWPFKRPEEYIFAILLIISIISCFQMLIYFFKYFNSETFGLYEWRAVLSSIIQACLFFALLYVPRFSSKAAVGILAIAIVNLAGYLLLYFGVAADDGGRLNIYAYLPVFIFLGASGHFLTGIYALVAGLAAYYLQRTKTLMQETAA